MIFALMAQLASAPTSPSIFDAEIAPHDGAVGVPRNARVFVTHPSAFDVVTDGATVGAERFDLAGLAVPLTPNATNELMIVSGQLDERIVLRFDVVDVEDIEPPSAPIIRGARVDDGDPVVAFLPGADEHAVAFHFVTNAAGHRALFFADDVGAAAVEARFEATGAALETFTVTTVDLAGQLSAVDTVDVAVPREPAGCAASPPAPALAALAAIARARRRRA